MVQQYDAVFLVGWNNTVWQTVASPPDALDGYGAVKERNGGTRCGPLG